MTKIKGLDAVPGLIDYMFVEDRHKRVHTAIVMQRPAGSTDLLEHLEKVEKGLQSPFAEPELRSILNQLFSVTLKLREVDLYHPDIKLENVLFNKEKGKLHLIDYGNIFDYPSGESFRDAFLGTVSCAPPEMMKSLEKAKGKRRPRVTYQTDEYLVWSIGLVAYELAAGSRLSHRPGAVSQGLSRAGYSRAMTNYLEQCLALDYADRLRLDEAAGHPWLSMEYEDIIIDLPEQGDRKRKLDEESAEKQDSPLAKKGNVVQPADVIVLD